MDGSDEHILRTVGARLEAARLDRGLSQAQLAEEAGIGKRTVERMEAGASASMQNWIRVLRVLGLLDGMDALVPERPVSPLALLRAEKGRRKRAGRKRAGPADGPEQHGGGADRVREARPGEDGAAGGWTWGDDA